jgi:Terpene synthase family 2, C-terminal metal binding
VAVTCSPGGDYFGIRNPATDRLLGPVHPLGSFPPADREATLRGAAGLLPPFAERAGQYQVLAAGGTDADRSRLAFCALHDVIVLPHAEPGQHLDSCMFGLLGFAFDDITDRVVGDYRDDQIEAFAADCVRVVQAAGDPVGHRPGTDPASQVLAALSETCARVRGYPAASTHYPNMLRHWQAHATATVRELRWSADRDQWPTYPDYLANGAVTSYFGTWWAAVLIIAGPLPARPAHAELVRRASAQISTAGRILNDIRTSEREKADGTPNAVAILEATGLDRPAVLGRLLAAVDRHRADLEAVLAGYPPELQSFGRCQHRQLAFMHDWYLARDTHGFSLAELAQGQERAAAAGPAAAAEPGGAV